MVKFVSILCSFLLFEYLEQNKLTMAANLVNVTLNDINQSANAFSLQMYMILSKYNQDRSILISPVSLQLVLALAYAGARGKTAAEISKALQLRSNTENNMLNGHRMLVNSLKAPELHIATKMFVENQLHIKEDFQKKVNKYLESEVENVNFTSDNNVTNIINKWVEHKTNGKIKDLFTNDVLNTNTVTVLISVIYFKAIWQLTFPESETYKGNFHVTENEINEVDMMCIYDEKFRYLEHSELKAKIIEIPYKDQRFSMYIILPDSINGLPALEEKLHKTNIYDEFKKLQLVSLDITIPKFKLSQTVDYKDLLQEVGITTMFSEFEADFSGISDGPLVVSNIMQNTFIEINEKGTEAAAGTGLVISLRSFDYKVRFTANHPFLFLITKSSRYKKSKPMTLFIGKFNSK